MTAITSNLMHLSIISSKLNLYKGSKGRRKTIQNVNRKKERISNMLIACLSFYYKWQMGFTTQSNSNNFLEFTNERGVVVVHEHIAVS